ncbi:MAG: ATP-binding protein [Bacteroidales bacterium]|jgi:predicted AAA+ superfamily ATPase|nr:ATP-binding protein [Bacteroidales bacterium]
MITRLLKTNLLNRLNDHKAIIVLGPRQCGKTTLVTDLLSEINQKILVWNGDDFSVRSLLKEPSLPALYAEIGDARYLFIDEAQRIENIGLALKLIIDRYKDIKIIATGSSAFELANRLSEPMTGRKWEFTLLPFSFKEMADAHGLMTEKGLLSHRLVYGYYPEVVTHPADQVQILKQLVNSYLYKDILIWERILKPEKLERLVQALAFQVGHEVSYHELGKLTGLDNQTVERYIDLLEKAFIVFRLSSLSRNLRNELKKSRKIYFFDNGLRNAIINSFNPITLRNDTGALWENFMVSERYKLITLSEFYCNRYFWRTTAQQEIDYIEEANGIMTAYEFKFNPNETPKHARSFLNAYPGSEIKVINRENFIEFLGVY